jgi:hypothetical protein
MINAAEVGTDSPRVQMTVSLYNEVAQLLQNYARMGNLLDNSILILSVLTSGAFWALASDALSKVFGWIGAVISTVVTGLTIYMYTSGVQRKRKKAQMIFTEIGNFIVKVRSQPDMTEQEFWTGYKFFEAAVAYLKTGRGDD